jgi:signal transduction histidine kinase
MQVRARGGWTQSPWARVAWDVGPTIVLFLIGALASDGRDPREPLAYLLLVLPLVARRWLPFATLAVIAFLAVLMSRDLSGPGVPVVSVALASFATGELGGDRARTALGVVAIAGLMAFGFLLQEANEFLSIVLPFAVVLPSWLVGDVVRTRRVDAARHAEESARALRETEERLRAAAAEERRHMARELHDVVAHGVSVMLIQAGAARQVLDTAPDRAADSILTVESTGREVMAELRRLLGVLNDDSEATGLAPQPGIDQLGPLVERVRQAGLPAELEIDGLPRPLPASLDVTAYRIVQEALTNALRYARRARTLVHVAYDEDMLRLEILDDGPAAEAGDSDGSGRGLVGMQERATIVGGRLEAGPRLGGGYAVRAWLPMAAEPA